MNRPVLHSTSGASLRHILSNVRVLASFFVAGALSLQAAHGATISGRVSNQATGDSLPGAVVSVEGTRISVVAQRGGTFSLVVPEGDYTLVASYSGLDTARVPVSATSETLIANIQLTSEVYQLEPFSVSGVREGNALAIQTQRQAENPKWVVAIDTFGNPAGNPGELIQRLPGISTDIVGGEVRTLFIRGMGTGFSSIMLDGERVATSTGTSNSRDYQIEQLGTGNLDSVELIKAPQPDQDANAVAGYVNLVSRRAFDLPGRRITLTAGGIWRHRGIDESPFKDRLDGLDLLSLAYSDVFSVFGAENNLGIAFNISRRVTSTTQDEMGPAGAVYFSLPQGYFNGNTGRPLTRAWGTGEFGAPSEAYNSGLSVDYKISPDAYVFAKLTYNINNQDQIGYRNGFGNPAASAANFSPDSTYEHSFLLPHAASVATMASQPDFTKNFKSYALTGGAEFKLFQSTATLNVRGSYSYANITYPGVINLRAVARGIGFEIDRRGQDEWYPIIRQTDGPSIYDPASYTLTTKTRQHYQAPNDIYSLRADFTKAIDLPVPTSIKIGAKYTDDFRKPFTRYTRERFVGADRIPNTVDDALTPYADLHYRQGGGHYGPMPYVTMAGLAKVPEGYYATTATDAYSTYATTAAGDNKFRETISAGYIQGSLQLGKLRVLGGVRVEDTKTEGTGWVRNTTASWGGNNVGGTSLDPTVIAANIARAERSFVRRNTAKGQYRDVFPGMHFVYEPLDGLLVRASYNRSISRPAVASLIPSVTENLDTNTISVGNPELKPYHSDNFEVSVERYFEPVGLFSVGVFLKEISDYSRVLSSTVGPEGIDGSGTYAGYALSTRENVGSARVRGFELSYQQQFSFLPGLFKGLGAFANYTYLQSEGDYGTTTATNKLANLVPRTGNAGINYRFRGLDARVLLNWTGQFYKGTSSGIDIYAEDRRLVDVKLQYSINRRYDVFLDATNITDEPTRTDIALNGIRYYSTKQGVGFTAGVRARF